MKKPPYDYCFGSNDLQLIRSIIADLGSAGFTASGDAKSAPEFLRLLRIKSPWLAIIDPRIPPGRAAQLASIIEEDGLAAVLFISSTGKEIAGHMVLKWPDEKNALAAVAEALCLEFSRKKKLLGKIDQLEKRLSDRKVIEQAKGLLMNKMKITEDEAFRYMRDESMAERINLSSYAEKIIKLK